MLTESQIVFDYAQDHPELIESIFREEVRKALSQEAARRCEEADLDTVAVIRDEVTRSAKAMAERAFYMNFELTDEPLVKTAKRECTERVLELRMALINAMNSLNRKMNRLESVVESHLGRDDLDQEDDEDTWF